MTAYDLLCKQGGLHDEDCAIIFSQFDTGIKTDNICEPYCLEGTLSITLTENEMASSAYAFTVVKMMLGVYKYQCSQ